MIKLFDKVFFKRKGRISRETQEEIRAACSGISNSLIHLQERVEFLERHITAGKQAGYQRKRLEALVRSIQSLLAPAEPKLAACPPVSRNDEAHQAVDCSARALSFPFQGWLWHLGGFSRSRTVAGIVFLPANFDARKRRGASDQFICPVRAIRGRTHKNWLQDAVRLNVPVVQVNWFTLREVPTDKHGTPRGSCESCGLLLWSAGGYKLPVLACAPSGHLRTVPRKPTPHEKTRQSEQIRPPHKTASAHGVQEVRPAKLRGHLASWCAQSDTSRLLPCRVEPEENLRAGRR